MSLSLFKILGFDAPVSIPDLKSRYKELAKKYHPDVNRSSDAEDKFKQINVAYQQLLLLAPTTSSSSYYKEAKKAANKEAAEKKEVEQTIFRILKENLVNVYETTFPSKTLPKNTRIFLMIQMKEISVHLNGTVEFSIFVDQEKILPYSINVNTSIGGIRIKIEEGY